MAGGLGGSDSPSGDVREFSLDDGAALRTWPLRVPRYLHGEVRVAPGEHLLLGGLTGSPTGLLATPAVELLDLRKGTSERLADLPFATVEPLLAALPDSGILVLGGYGDEDTLVQTAILDSLSGAWQSTPPLPSARAASTVVRLGPRHLLFAGGWTALGAPWCDDGLLLDLTTFEWHTADIAIPPDAAITDLGAGSFLVLGGKDAEGAPIATATLWTLDAPLP